MKLLLVALLALTLVSNPVAAAPKHTLDVVEIDWFYYDECQNAFHWQTNTEIILDGFRVENPDANWVGRFVVVQNPGGGGATYIEPGQNKDDYASGYWLRVYFNGYSSRMEDVAVIACGQR